LDCCYKPSESSAGSFESCQPDSEAYLTKHLDS